jgi:hypothetical protein
MRILINGGNSNAAHFFNKYGLMEFTIQKRYSTVAANAYRQKIHRSLDKGNLKPIAMPTFEEGRKIHQITSEYNKQLRPYSELNCK